MAGVVGFEPTNGGFRIRCLNRTWRYPSTWCGRRDSNSHDSRHSHLKAARLPISPRPHFQIFSSQLDLRLAERSELYIGLRTLQEPFAFFRRFFVFADAASVLAGVVGFEPTNGGFRIRCLNRTWRYPSTWCGRRDSNSHDSRHSHLKAARLPISPRPLADFLMSSLFVSDQRRWLF